MATPIDPKTLPASHPLNTDTYAVGGGRLTGYEATIVNSYYDAYRGKGKGEGDKYYPYLVWELDDVVLADGEPHEPIVVRNLAGWLAPGRDPKTGDYYKDRVTGQPLPGVMPSDDGINPAGATVDEYRSLGEGTASITPGTEEQYRGRRTCGNRVKAAKKKGDKAAPAWFALESISEAPVDGSDDQWNGWTPDGWCNDFIGLRCRFDAVDKPGADGVTLITRIISGPGTPAGGAAVAKPAVVTAASKPTTTTAATTAATTATTTATSAVATTNGNAELDAQIAAMLVELVDASPAKSLKLQEVATPVMQKVGPAAVKRIKEASVHEQATALAMLNGNVWTYDGVKMTLTAAS